MKSGISFAPGPSQLYFTVDGHMRRAFRNGIPSISHRSSEFEKFFLEATEGLRELLGVPSDFSIVFTSSATEIWERIIQNCVEESSHHFVNGAFSKRFYEIALQLGKKSTQQAVEDGNGFSTLNENISTELFALTHNETSTGVSLPLEFIHQFRTPHPNSLIAVDAVSSLPHPEFDYSKIDTVFFSVQKGFGLPAGLGVWIVNGRCIAKAEELQVKGKFIGSYHSLTSLVVNARKNQTPETPNVLGIYILGKVVQDMLRKGILSIRRETEYKAAILYQALDQHPILNPFVSQKEFQSKTVIVSDCGNHAASISKFLSGKGLVPGEGYGQYKNQHLRFANFPTHSKEQFELLVDSIADYNA